MRKFPTECRGCYRETRGMACFMTDISEWINCPCLNCLVKTNCYEICSPRKEVIDKYSKEIASTVYDAKVNY